MGTIILVLALIIEAAFAAYCIFTKSDQRRVRNYIRVGAFAAFVLLTLVSVIQWSARWYLLALLLLIWALPGVWGLVRQKSLNNQTAQQKVFKPASRIVRASATLLLILIAVTPALIFPQYKQPKVTGSHPVATVTYTYTDTSRSETFSKTGGNRQVNVEFWYPQDGDGPYPLVVFSHGAFGVKASNTSTFMELASNGYVVCSIDHPYHSLYTSGADGHMVTVYPAFMQEVQDVNSGKYDDATAFKIEKRWMQQRIDDIHFVLNTILALSKDASSGTVYQRIDPAKIGLIGHSLGAESSAEVARERKDISAVVNLDADLGGEYVAYQDGKYVLNDTPYPVPILNIFADDMVRLMDAIQDPNIVIAVKHVIATAPTAFQVHLTGTNHMSLTDLPLVSPFMVSMINSSVPKGGGSAVAPLATIEKMNALVLQFFNVYLKNEGSFTVSGSD